MRLLVRRRPRDGDNTDAAAPADADRPAVPRRTPWRKPTRPAGEWTFGTSLATRGVHIGLLACLAAGPAALAVAAVGSAPAPVQQVQVVAPAAPDGALRASAAAQRLVVTWLTASRSDASTLGAQLLEPVTSIDLQLPAIRPKAPSRVWVEDAQPAGDARWEVMVGAQGGSAGAGSYYLVPVHLDQDGATPLTLPARAAAPVKADGANLDGGVDLAIGRTDPAAVTVAGYLTAFLAGRGDLDRWTAPGTALRAIQPPPCHAVDVQQVTTTLDELPPPTTDGAQAEVLATATCSPKAGAATVSQYPLLLRARGARWEVAAAGSTPTTTSQPTPPTPAAPPAPSTTPR